MRDLRRGEIPLMTTRLGALFWKRIPRHPLFVMRFRPLPPIRHRPEWLNSVLVTVGGTAILGLSVFIPLLTLIIGLLILGGILCVPLGGTLRGVILAGMAAQGIANESQDPPRMALFHMTPPGRLGIAWLLAARAIRLSRRYRLFSLAVTIAQISGYALGVILILFINAYLTPPYGVLATLGMGFSAVCWLIVNTMQMPILGVVCGLLGATVGTRSRVVVSVAVGVYLTVTAGCLTLSLLILATLNQINWEYANSRDAIFKDIGLFLSIVIINFALHEIMLRLLWRWVCRRMNADGREVMLV